MRWRSHDISKRGWIWTALSAVLSLVYFFPVFWIFMTAFKTRNDALAVPAKFLFTPTMDNFARVFERAVASGESVSTGFGLYFFNSIFIAGVSVLLAIILGSAAAYAFSRYPLRGNDTYLFIILTTRMMPPIIVIIPIFLLFRVADLTGSYTGIILLYTAFNLPFSIWMMKSFFDELPIDVEDAARLDGSTDRRVFFKICLPQVWPGIAATAVFGLILTWNEFLFALMLTGANTRTVPVALARTLGGELGVDWGLLSAVELLFILPVIAVTFVLQNQLMRGVTFGTIKR